MKAKKILKAIGKVCLILIIIHSVMASLSQTIVRAKINKFDPVSYKDRIVPEIDNEGYYTFTTDRDFKVMQINDIHLCGGIFSLKKDLKSVDQVMTIVSAEKPDLVILNGDSVFCVPYPIYNGGMTFNNAMASKTIIHMFEHLNVYFSVTFGNHDTEAFDFTNRKNLGKIYSRDKYKYCIFNCDYNGYGVTNQCILVKNSKGQITKTLMLIDSNDYIDNSLSSSINWRYDTIHQEQIDWAENTLMSLSGNSVNKKALFFFHIPIGEFETAYRKLKENNFRDTLSVKFVSGYWNEKTDEEMGGRIWYGGCCQTDKKPEDVDNFFETLGPDGADMLDGVFCGHDHVNNAHVKYRGVDLCYGYSIDNNAYDNIEHYGLQRGCMVITIDKRGNFSVDYKNLYRDYGYDSTGVDMTNHYYPDCVEKN